MNKKKALTLLASVALIGAMGVGATLAYFTDTEDAANIVTMGNVNIKLTESDGTKITSDGLTFTDVLPGQTVTKKPMISLDGTSEDAYIRVSMKITMENATAEQQAFLDELEDDLTAQILGEDYITNGWYLNEDGYYYYNQVLDDKDDIAVLFDTVTIPTDWDNTMAGAEFSIVLTAEAIQADYTDSVILKDTYGRVIDWQIVDSGIQDYDAESGEAE